MTDLRIPIELKQNDDGGLTVVHNCPPHIWITQYDDVNWIATIVGYYCFACGQSVLDKPQYGFNFEDIEVIDPPDIAGWGSFWLAPEKFKLLKTISNNNMNDFLVSHYEKLSGKQNCLIRFRQYEGIRFGGPPDLILCELLLPLSADRFLRELFQVSGVMQVRECFVMDSILNIA